MKNYGHKQDLEDERDEQMMSNMQANDQYFHNGLDGREALLSKIGRHMEVKVPTTGYTELDKSYNDKNLRIYKENRKSVPTTDNGRSSSVASFEQPLVDADGLLRAQVPKFARKRTIASLK